MDFQAIKASLPMFNEGLLITVKLGVLGIVLSLVLGFIFAFLLYYRVPFVQRIIKAYIELSRNTPLLIQLFFLYYGLPKIGLPISKEVAGVVGLTFLGAAYMAEAFRGSFKTIPQAQIESGKALGFSRWQLTKWVIMPQALPLSVPSVGANVIFLLKETSVFSGIAIMDLTNTARDLIGMYYLTREYLFVLVVYYIVLVLPVIGIVTLLERRVAHVRA
jgi:polar amino acid transport system permease protein